MSGNEMIYQGSPASASWGGNGRAMARLSRGTEMQVAQVGAHGQVELARMEAIDVIAGRAMQGVALVSQMEQQLAAQNPYAATRLQAIGDMHAYTLANELSTFARRVQ